MVIVIFSKAYIIMCEVGYVRQYNVPPLSFHITLTTWYQSLRFNLRV